MDKREEKVKAVKFALLGLTTTAVESLTYALFLFFALSHTAAQIFSYAIGAANSYIVNRKCTFKTREKFWSTAFLKCAVVNLLSLFLGVLVMLLFTRILHLGGSILKDAAAKSAVMFLTAISNYLGNRLWVFK